MEGVEAALDFDARIIQMCQRAGLRLLQPLVLQIDDDEATTFMMRTAR